jgi:hypothetical protein
MATTDNVITQTEPTPITDNLNTTENTLIPDGVVFGNVSSGVAESKTSQDENEEDLTQYTLVDNLDEDDVIPSQRFALFSFLSPEGIMNCDIRAVKFRGAFPTSEAAEKHVRKLEKKDKYFKIYMGETGKWLEFNPSEEHIEEERTDNPEMQQILDSRRKQKEETMNELAGRHKNNVDKEIRGGKERADASKTNAAISAKSKKKNKTVVRQSGGREAKRAATIESMKRKLAERKAKNVGFNDKTEDITVVNKGSEAESNIEKIRQRLGK